MFFLSFSLVSRFVEPRNRKRARRSAPLTRRLSYDCLFERLEDRVVPSTLTTNKQAYAPTDLAILTADGFQPGETVNFTVVRSNGTTAVNFSIADGGPGDQDGSANGMVVANWQIPPDSPGQTFTVTAAGELSLASAQTTFTGLTTWVYSLPTDYAPGQTANVYAGGFTVGENVDFQ